MKMIEIRGKDTRELQLDLQALSKEQFQLHFRSASEEVATTHRFTAIRRDIARIKTELRRREIDAAVAAPAARDDG